MALNVGQVTRVFRTYQTQERIAELNRQSGLKTVQSQQDQVSISSRGRELLAAQAQKVPGLGDSPSADPTAPGTESPSTPSPEVLDGNSNTTQPLPQV